MSEPMTSPLPAPRADEDHSHVQPDAQAAFGRLLRLMDELREHCPWDQKQTFESLRHLSIEEVYELSDAILDGERQQIKVELGDLLLHIVFYTRLAKEEAAFDMGGLIHQLCDKLIRRHPHIYGQSQVSSEGEVLQNWEQIKLKEGAKSVLGGVPQSLPALVKAYRIQEKVASVGFDWPEAGQVLDKLQEELQELADAKAQGEPQARLEEEFGDILFSVINYARHVGINPEDALERTNKKFMARFNTLEASAKADGKPLHEHSLEELEARWQQAKESTKA